MRRPWGVAVLLVAAATGVPPAAGETPPPGTLDPTFRTDDIPQTAAFDAMAVDSANRVVAVGRFGLVRLLPDGGRDPAFTAPETPGGHGPWADLALATDGRIVVAGGYPDIAVGRRETDGRPDPSFGQMGETVTDLPDDGAASAVAIPPDGRIVVAGVSGRDVVVLRYTSDGHLDRSFGSDGVARAALGEHRADVADVAVAPDGGIVVAATDGRFLSYGLATAPVVLRFLPDGALDLTFGTHGRVVPAVGGDDGGAGAVAVRPDGRLVVGLSGVNGLSVLGLLPDGRVDAAFGRGGVATAVGACGPADIGALAVDRDGKVLAVGSNGDQLTVARFGADGAVDRAFGNAGTVLPLPAEEVSSSRGTAIVLQQDGKAVVAGQTSRQHGHSFVARLLTAGDAPAKERADPRGQGYWLAATHGAVAGFGGTRSCGAVQLVARDRRAVGLAATPTGVGYWIAGADGGVFAFGDAPFHGSLGALRLAAPVVGIAGTPSGAGYWLAAADGGVFAFGDAPFLGSMAGRGLAAPVVGMAATATGRGYWLAAADGGVFAFGDAGFLGATAGRRLVAPVVGIAATGTGRGYWLVGADGGVFAFGDAPFLGSMAAQPLGAPVVGLAPSPGSRGYRLAAADGGVFAFGEAPFFGAWAPWACCDEVGAFSTPAPGPEHRTPVVGIASS